MSNAVARFRFRALTLGVLAAVLLAGAGAAPSCGASLRLLSFRPLAEAASPAPLETPPAATLPIRRKLSNEKTLTTWAHPLAAGPILSHPEAHAKRIARIHFETEDGFPEVYLLLSSYTDATGEEWVHMRIPGRPNGRTGWVSRGLLGTFETSRWLIVISLSKRSLKAYFAGHLRRSAPVGVGKPSTPTPAGHFWIRERFRVTDRTSPYYPYALGTSDYSTLSEWPGGGVVGIHGPFGEPQAIPGDPSHGCVRMLPADIAWLGPRVSLGTPVEIVR